MDQTSEDYSILITNSRNRRSKGTGVPNLNSGINSQDDQNSVSKSIENFHKAAKDSNETLRSVLGIDASKGDELYLRLNVRQLLFHYSTKITHFPLNSLLRALKIG